jgi:hypothetical protein
MSTIDPGTEQSSREIGTTAKLVEEYSKWEFNSEVMIGGNFPIYFGMRFVDQFDSQSMSQQEEFSGAGINTGESRLKFGLHNRAVKRAAIPIKSRSVGTQSEPTPPKIPKTPFVPR